jgi:hypothetical protein
MRFNDYLIYEALRENNRALRALGQRQPQLGDSAVGEISAVVERLGAYWQLLGGSIPAADRRAARERLRRIQRALAYAWERVTLSRTIDLLARNAPSDKSRHAVQLLVEELNAPGPNAVQLAAPRDLVARDLQEESLSWRTLDRDAIDPALMLDQYRRSYRKGRRSGLRALDAQNARALGRWRRWVAVSLEQLELVRVALPEQCAQTRFYLERLNESLAAHRDLMMVRAMLLDTDLSDKQKNRVAALVELRMRYSLERAAKLYPNCYRYAPKRYLATLQRALRDLDFVALVTELESRTG